LAINIATFLVHRPVGDLGRLTKPATVQYFFLKYLLTFTPSNRNILG